MMFVLEILKRNWLSVLLLSIILVLSVRVGIDKIKISSLQAKNASCSASLALQNQAVLHQAKLAKEEELKAKKAEKLAHEYHDREMDKIRKTVKNIPRDCEGAMAFLVDDVKS